MASKRIVTCDGCGKETLNEKDDWRVSIDNFWLEGKDENNQFDANYDLCLDCVSPVAKAIKTYIGVLRENKGA